jgi:hypothetical protein
MSIPMEYDNGRRLLGDGINDFNGLGAMGGLYE